MKIETRRLTSNVKPALLVHAALFHVKLSLTLASYCR